MGRLRTPHYTTQGPHYSRQLNPLVLVIGKAASPPALVTPQLGQQLRPVISRLKLLLSFRPYVFCSPSLGPVKAAGVAATRERVELGTVV